MQYHYRTSVEPASGSGSYSSPAKLFRQAIPSDHTCDSLLVHFRKVLIILCHDSLCALLSQPAMLEACGRAGVLSRVRCSQRICRRRRRKRRSSAQLAALPFVQRRDVKLIVPNNSVLVRVGLDLASMSLKCHFKTLSLSTSFLEGKAVCSQGWMWGACVVLDRWLDVVWRCCNHRSWRMIGVGCL